MELKRRAASGTLAEIFGEAALDFDVGMRTLNLQSGALKDVEVLSKRELSVL